ncbi:RICIN domain-containing protein [Kitasatospora sp. NPDC001574]
MTTSASAASYAPASDPTLTRITAKADGKNIASSQLAGVQWQNVNSGKCLVTQGFGDSSAFQFTCAGYADQQWNLVPDSSGQFFQLKNVHSSKCLVAQGFGDSGAFQSTCAGFADQFWAVYVNSSGQYKFQNANSGKCLLVQGGADNNPVVQYTCLNFPDQLWW